MSDNTDNSHSASGGLPRFVEPDYNIDTSVPVVKEAEPEPCCTRCTSEWRYPWFSIQDGDKTLDIPASFGPSSWQARVIKFGFVALFNVSLVYKWYTKREYPAFFLSFLTNWSLIFSAIWTIVSFINSLVPPAQPKRPSDSVSLWTKFCWLLFTVACEFSLITTILYWSLDYKPGKSNMDFINVFTHAGVLLVWPEGLLVNRIPIRMKHMTVSMFLAALYVCWLAIHQMATDIGNPYRSDNDQDTNDDLLYTAMDFEEKTAFSTTLGFVVVFVAVPLMHLLLWSLSLMTCPCNCSGYNRRYVTETRASATGDAPAPTDNVNIYDP